jgi:hypothetical protein
MDIHIVAVNTVGNQDKAVDIYCHRLLRAVGNSHPEQAWVTGYIPVHRVRAMGNILAHRDQTFARPDTGMQHRLHVVLAVGY